MLVQVPWLLWTLLIATCVFWLIRSRRVAGNHPYCRNCEYDVSAQWRVGEPVSCPECGVLLVDRSRIRLGRRQPPWARILPVIGLLSVLAVPLVLNWSGIDVVRFLPSWYLRVRVQSAARWPAVDAYKELERRHFAGDYPVSKLIDAGLDLIEGRPDAIATSFQYRYPNLFLQNANLEQSNRLLDFVEEHSDLKVGGNVSAGQPLAFAVGRDLYLPDSIEVDYQIDQVSLNDVALEVPLPHAKAGEMREYRLTQPLPVGRHTLQVDITLGIGSFQGDPFPFRTTPFEAVVARKLILRRSFGAVVGLAVPSQAWDAAADAKLLSRLSVGRSGHHMLILSTAYSIDPGEIVPNLSHEFFIDFGYGMRSWPGEFLSFEAERDQDGQDWLICGSRRRRGSIEKPLINVLLVPSARQARRNVQIEPVWPRAILFRDVNRMGEAAAVTSLTEREYRELIPRDPNMDLAAAEDAE